MKVVSADWSERHKALNRIIRKAEFFIKAIEVTLDLHSELHSSAVSNSVSKNNIDLLFEDIQQSDYAVVSSSNDETIAWAIWHIARIEDLTMNILVHNAPQIFNELWKKRLQVINSDTGNSMTDDEMLKFSKQINISELLNYRNAVGINSREILRSLKFDDMKRKISPDSISRILKEGGVTEQADSIWLLDFWGKKDVAGIILMPLTRHQTLHLNDCYKWKESILTKNGPAYAVP